MKTPERVRWAEGGPAMKACPPQKEDGVVCPHRAGCHAKREGRRRTKSLSPFPRLASGVKRGNLSKRFLPFAPGGFQRLKPRHLPASFSFFVWKNGISPSPCLPACNRLPAPTVKGAAAERAASASPTGRRRPAVPVPLYKSHCPDASLSVGSFPKEPSHADVDASPRNAVP